MTLNVTLFNDNWYHGIINQTLDGHQDASEDAHLVAAAIMTGLACIAQAIDAVSGATDHVSLVGALGDASSALTEAGRDVADAIRELKPEEDE